MIKHLLLVTLSLFLTRGISAQPNIPVDHHSGKPIINLPLWEMREGELRVPLSLSYDASGVKLADVSNWVGLKWGLSAEGSITRVVKGIPDDMVGTTDHVISGWLSSGNAAIGDSFSPTANTSGCEGEAWTSLAGYMSNLQDKEPDVFLLEAPGITARFVFDNNGIPRLLPYQQLKISYEKDSNGKITEFTVINDQGAVYTFGNKSGGYTDYTIERSIRSIDIPDNQTIYVDFLKREYAYYKKPVSYNSKWQLRQIVSASGKRIDYKYVSHQRLMQYSPEYLVTRSSTSLYTACNGTVGSCEGKSEYILKDESTRSVLTEILSSTSSVKFISEATALNNEIDVFLKSIRVSELEGNTLVKEFLLGYTIAASEKIADNGTIVTGDYNRRFLTGVTEQADCLSLPPYQFTYHGLKSSSTYSYRVSLPDPSSYQQDFWGYYNRNSSKTLSPQLYIYPAMQGADRYRIYPMKAGKFTGEQVILAGANRMVDGNNVLQGTLKNMTYPTGGTVELELQPNTFYDSGGEQEVLAGGLRVKAIKAIRRVIPNDPTQLETIVLKEFFYKQPANGLTSGKPVALPVLAFPTTFYRPIGTTVNRLTLEEMEQAGYTSNQKWDYLTVRAAFDLSDYEQWVDYSIAYTDVTEKIPGNGRTDYKFELSNTWGETQSGEWAATPTQVTSKKGGDPLDCPPPGHVGSGFYTFPFPTSTNYDFERGRLQKETLYTEAGAPVKETQYTYQQISGEGGAVTVHALKFDMIPSYVTKLTYVNRDGDTSGDYTITELTGQPIYLYGVYKLLANVDKALASQVETWIDNTGKRLSTTTSYTYDKGLLSKISTTGADGSLSQTYMRYPKDFAILENGASLDSESADEFSAMVRRMKEKHMFGTLLETIKTLRMPGKLDEVVSAAEMTAFKDFDSPSKGKIYPAAMYQLKNGIGLKYTSFVPSGTVLSNGTYVFQPGTGYEVVAQVPGYDLKDKALGLVEPRSQRVKSFHFGYKYALPVAEIADARADAVVFSNFETQTDYGFAVSAPVYAAGRTGTKGLKLASGQLLYKDDIWCGDAATYIVSLWIKAPGVDPISGSLSVRLAGVNGTITTNNFSYSAKTSEWSLLQVKVPVSQIGVNQRFRAELTTNTALLIDDVTFYPSVASLVTNTFEPFKGKTSETDVNGSTKFYEYDALGNLETIRDQDRNILQQTKYVRYNEKGSLQTKIVSENGFYDKHLYDGDAIAFSAKPLYCQISGVTYTWNLGDGSPEKSGSSITHIYPFVAGGEPKGYTITLTASHIDLGTYQITKGISIHPKPLEVSICADGPVMYDACKPTDTQTLKNGECTTRTISSGYDYTIYKVNVIPNCSGPYTYQWQIMSYGVNNEWKNIDGATGASLSLSYRYSYEVRCLVTGCGRKGESQAYQHIVYNGEECDGGSK